MIYNAGLLDLAAAYTKETGKKVVVTSVGMGTIVKAVKTSQPQRKGLPVAQPATSPGCC